MRAELPGFQSALWGSARACQSPCLDLCVRKYVLPRIALNPKVSVALKKEVFFPHTKADSRWAGQSLSGAPHVQLFCHATLWVESTLVQWPHQPSWVLENQVSHLYSSQWRGRSESQ